MLQAFLTLTLAPAAAAVSSTTTLGEVTSVTCNAAQCDISALSSAKATVPIRVVFRSPTVVRFWAAFDGNFTDNGAEDDVIVALPPSAKPPTASVFDKGEHYEITVTGSALIVSVAKSPMLVSFSWNGVSVVGERAPLTWNSTTTWQTTTAAASDAHFFGGGMQNGRWIHDGTGVTIGKDFNWADKGHPNSVPWFISSSPDAAAPAFGVLRCTWRPGQYDFPTPTSSRLRVGGLASGPGAIVTAHNESNRFDAYYAFGANAKALLGELATLTGAPFLPPLYGVSFPPLEKFQILAHFVRCDVTHTHTLSPSLTPSPTPSVPLARSLGLGLGDSDCYHNSRHGNSTQVAIAVADEYVRNDIPVGWMLVNDGYGCGYGEGDAVFPANLTDLAYVFAELHKRGLYGGLWTSTGMPNIVGEVKGAGSRVCKTDVGWIGAGYKFAFDGVALCAGGIENNSDARRFIWTVEGWAGTHRNAVMWTGDDSGSWEYIRWQLPTFVGCGFSIQAHVSGDVDGIFGGSAETYVRDLQFKALMTTTMVMSGWAANPDKQPWTFGEPFTSINRKYQAEDAHDAVRVHALAGGHRHGRPAGARARARVSARCDALRQHDRDCV